MRRWFLTIPAFLLLGAVVNVAVAWGSVWPGQIWPFEDDAILWKKSGLIWLEAGWPLHCLRSEWSWQMDSELRVSRAIRLGNKILPIRPIPSGFAVNTLFYGTLLWLLLLGAFVLRRFLRLRRGLCPKCAYPMGESAVCTECGNPLLRRRPMANPT